MCAGMVTNVFFNDCMNMGTGREENVIQCHMVMGFQKVIFNSVGGSLPGSALLYLRQLSLFGMICHRDGNI